MPSDDSGGLLGPLFSGSGADPEVRARLVAVAEAGRLRFDIRLQGDQETPFLAL